MSEDGHVASSRADEPEDERVAEHLQVSVARTGFERYQVTTASGAQLEFGRGEGLVQPAEMLMAALAGCMAVCVDKPLTRGGEPERFAFTVDADKLKDSVGAVRLDGLDVTFDLALAEWTRRQDPEVFVERLMDAAHERICAVSRTLEHGAAVAASAQVEITGATVEEPGGS
jgi:putative redox protein